MVLFTSLYCGSICNRVQHVNTWSCVHMGIKTSLLNQKFQFQENPNIGLSSLPLHLWRALSLKIQMPPELFVPREQFLESFDSDQFQLLQSFKSDQLQKYTLRVQLIKLVILGKSCEQIWQVFKTKQLLGSKNVKSWTTQGGVRGVSRERWVEF